MLDVFDAEIQVKNNGCYLVEGREVYLNNPTSIR